MNGENGKEESGKESSNGDQTEAPSQLDLKSLENSFGEDRLRDIVVLFLRTSDTLIQCLRAALEGRDVRAAHHYAYCIKGPASSLGQLEMAKQCQQIAESALRNKWFDADDAFMTLESVLKALGKVAGNSLGLADSSVLSPGADQTVADSASPAFAKLEKQLGKQTALALANAFLEDERGTLESIGACLDKKDAAGLKGLTHRLGGCCASILDKETQRLCKELQQMADDGAWSTTTDKFIEISKSLGETRKQIKEYAAKNKA